MNHCEMSVPAAATIGCAGDVLQQALEGKASLDDFDVARSARLATYRGLQAPVFDVSWSAFDRWFRHLPGAPGVVAKIAADQKGDSRAVETGTAAAGRSDGGSGDDHHQTSSEVSGGAGATNVGPESAVPCEVRDFVRNIVRDFVGWEYIC